MISYIDILGISLTLYTVIYHCMSNQNNYLHKKRKPENGISKNRGTYIFYGTCKTIYKIQIGRYYTICLAMFCVKRSASTKFPLSSFLPCAPSLSLSLSVVEAFIKHSAAVCCATAISQCRERCLKQVRVKSQSSSVFSGITTVLLTSSIQNTRKL